MSNLQTQTRYLVIRLPDWSFMVRDNQTMEYVFVGTRAACWAFVSKHNQEGIGTGIGRN